MTVSTPVRVIPWIYLGAEKIDAAGATQAALPVGTKIVAITAGGADVRYAINGVAGANSTPVPAGQTRVIGPIMNLNMLSIYNAGGSIAYLEYYREA